MNAEAGERARRRTANERVKSHWNAALCLSIVVAGAAHAAVLTLWPTMETGELRAVADRPGELIDLQPMAAFAPPPPPDLFVEPPPPPPPALEVEGEIRVEVDPIATPETIIPILPDLERSASADSALTRYIAFAPHMLRPTIHNLAEVESFMLERYRPYNAATGVEGEVTLDLWIDERGAVHHAEILESSGDAVLDRLGLELVRVVVFTPARSGSEAVAVNAAVPILFERVGDS